MSAAVALAHKPTVLLADDHTAVLQAVSRIVAPQFDVVGAVANGKAALDVAPKANPHLATSDRESALALIMADSLVFVELRIRSRRLILHSKIAQTTLSANPQSREMTRSPDRWNPPTGLR